MRAAQVVSRQLYIILGAVSALMMLVCQASLANPWADYVVEFNQSIGQHVGNPQFSDPAQALGPPTGGGTNWQNNSSVVSLGQGGDIVLGFNEPVVDDPLNPEGYDFIIFGNAFWLSGDPYHNKYIEPAYVEIAQDIDQNGEYDPEVDGPFYLILPPSKAPSELVPTQIGGGYNLTGDTGDTITPLAGYADISPTLVLGDIDVDNIEDIPGMDPADFYTVPDRHSDLVDTSTWEIDPGSCGGDAFDIKWAVEVDHYEDTTAFIAEGVWGSSSDQYYSPIIGTPIPKLDQYGQPVGANIDRFTFIRIVDAVPDDFQGLWGDIDSEIDAVADVTPVDFALRISSNLDQSITLSWDSIPAAQHYDIYYSDLPGSTIALCAEDLDTATLTWTDAGDTSRTHPSLTPSRIYTISVRRD